MSRSAESWPPRSRSRRVGGSDKGDDKCSPATSNAYDWLNRPQNPVKSRFIDGIVSQATNSMSSGFLSTNTQVFVPRPAQPKAPSKSKSTTMDLKLPLEPWEPPVVLGMYTTVPHPSESVTFAERSTDISLPGRIAGPHSSAGRPFRFVTIQDTSRTIDRRQRRQKGSSETSRLAPTKKPPLPPEAKRARKAAWKAKTTDGHALKIERPSVLSPVLVESTKIEAEEPLTSEKVRDLCEKVDVGESVGEGWLLIDKSDIEPDAKHIQNVVALTAKKSSVEWARLWAEPPEYWAPVSTYSDSFRHENIAALPATSEAGKSGKGKVEGSLKPVFDYGDVAPGWDAIASEYATAFTKRDHAQANKYIEQSVESIEADSDKSGVKEISKLVQRESAPRIVNEPPEIDQAEEKSNPFIPLQEVESSVDLKKALKLVEVSSNELTKKVNKEPSEDSNREDKTKPRETPSKNKSKRKVVNPVKTPIDNSETILVSDSKGKPAIPQLDTFAKTVSAYNGKFSWPRESKDLKHFMSKSARRQVSSLLRKRSSCQVPHETYRLAPIWTKCRSSSIAAPFLRNNTLWRPISEYDSSFTSPDLALRFKLRQRV